MAADAVLQPEGRAPAWVCVVEGATLATLLALAGTILTGYRFGDSNHGITVPILKRLMDPALYPGDVMVATAEAFPTVFYRVLGALLPGTSHIPAAFFLLYVVAIAATLAAAYRIGRWAGGPYAGVLALLFCMPVRIGLAGEALYRVAFSHSHLASALTLWAIVWFLEGRRLLPLIVLALGAYNHLLYSAYVLLPMGLVVLWEAWQHGDRPAWARAFRHLGPTVLILLPLAVWSLGRGTALTPEWLDLLRVRSAHHSFPSYFGADLPEAAALLGLAVLAASRSSLDRKRILALFLLGTALQFVLGTVFTEYWPVKAVLQYQPHRVWRFLLVLLRGFAAAGVVSGFLAGGLARVGAAITGVILFLPGLEALLPLALVLQAAVGRPVPPPWARALTGLLLVAVTGWDDREILNTVAPETLRLFLHRVVLSAAAIALVVLVAREAQGRWRSALTVGAALLTLFGLLPYAYGVARVRWEYGQWRALQNWARENTPPSAVFLTPPKEAGFRVFSERTTVAEWKDGTQQYFDDGFVRTWSERMQALGDDYPKLKAPALRDLARRYGASYVVLARRPTTPDLPVVYANEEYVIYKVAEQ